MALAADSNFKGIIDPSASTTGDYQHQRMYS